MNYDIHIIDTTDNTHVTSLENAERKSVILSYEGADEKDALDIVGSNLAFTLEVAHAGSANDGAFLDLFTGDERKYRVEIRKEADSTLLWLGHIRPDSYQEPYRSGTFYVNFEASCGLGSLKGKYLSDEFYSDEKTAIEIISACLKLTGLDLNLNFSPAITPTNGQSWSTIYVDTSHFTSRSRKDDAHKILKRLCNDMLCCVHQTLNAWHFEGLNKRNLITYQVQQYDSDGVFIQDIELSRNLKNINNHIVQTTPLVTQVPPYNLITVTHEREEPALPATLVKEENEGWTINAGVVGEIYANAWEGHNDFYAKAFAPNYNVRLLNSESGTLDTSKYVNLKNKVYLAKGQKIKISLEVTVVDTAANQQFNYVDSWQNPVIYEILINSQVIFSNTGAGVTDDERLNMQNTKSDQLDFEYTVTENGIFDVKIYQPYVSGEYVEYVQLDKVSIEPIVFDEDLIYEDVISEEFTIDKDVELEISDDASGFSLAWRLSRLRELGAVADTIDVPILYSFTQNGNNYSAVDLQGAVLILENPQNVKYGGTPLSNFEVIFNYELGEQMLIQTDIVSASGVFTVDIFNYVAVSQSRDHWEQWSDAVYGIESKRYGRTVTDVNRRMFAVQHAKADLTVDIPVAFTDIISWNYREPSNFFVNNLKWDLDAGESIITINRAVYQNDDTIEPGDNIPPLVTAPSPIYIQDSDTQAQLTSQSSDPDGFIASREWTQEGGNDANIQTPNQDNTIVSNLSLDAYQFKITVADDDAATAEALVDVIRLKDYTLSWTEIYSDVVIDPPSEAGEDKEKHYQLTVTPALPNNFTLNLNTVLDIEITTSVPLNGDEIVKGRFKLVKNTIELEDHHYFTAPADVSIPLVFNYNNTDTIVIKLEAIAKYPATPEEESPCNSSVKLTVNTASLVSGQGNILGIPLEQELTAAAPSV